MVLARVDTRNGWSSRLLPPRPGTTLAERLDPRHNSINAQRLVLAFTVLLSHAVQLATGHGDPLGRWTGSSVDLGTMAVDAFFALSGYLIVGSYLTSRSAGRYLWRRCLRILPAFWVCLVVSAVLIGPVTALADGDLEGYRWAGADSALTYVGSNAALLIRQFEITGGYGGLPVNDSVHTLFYEFLCYLLAAVVGVLGLYRRRVSRVGPVAVALWLLALLAVLAVPALVAGHPARQLLLRYGSMFLFGGLAHLLARRIRVLPLGYAVAGGAVVLAVALSTVGAERGLVLYTVLAAPAVAYAVLGLGSSTRFARIGATRDLSYGLYVYAWPVQITLIVMGVGDWWLPVFVVLGLALSLGLAHLSWTCVEAPALRLKSWTPTWPRRRRDRS